MASKIPATFKAITPFIRRAEELDRDRTRPESKMVAYYCRQYAMELGIKLREHDASDEATNYLLSLMESLELEKAALPTHTQEEGRVICENFAYDIFMRADEEDRSGGANKNTARTFYAAGSFFDILKQFGTPSEDIVEKTKYSKFKAADILKAIKEGRTPTPGAPTEQIPTATEDESPSIPLPSVQPVAEPPAAVYAPPPSPPAAPVTPPKAQPQVTPPASEFPNMAAFSYDINSYGGSSPAPTPAAAIPVAAPAPPSPPAAPIHVQPAASYQPPPPAYPSAPAYSNNVPPELPPSYSLFPEAPTQRPVIPSPAPAGRASSRRGGWSQNEVNDAMECAKFAVAALKTREVELAIQRLEQALQYLR
ncbi:hypothetical protein LEN26_010928 [Aphanomyces euteiches]|nr:hypothetical protein AeMF1_021455 [Aphanomyces euteiches]KAH9120901.1 hypothetical protein LEN26_010928 [Aphanomyces euteiches]KAH9181957.1 hypothetical protein AeNC1_016069 [Aphanomyces euteiches]